VGAQGWQGRGDVAARNGVVRLEATTVGGSEMGRRGSEAPMGESGKAGQSCLNVNAAHTTFRVERNLSGHWLGGGEVIAGSNRRKGG
jgi:hypothetical protein